jgi:hypothetical protein
MISVITPIPTILAKDKTPASKPRLKAAITLSTVALSNIFFHLTERKNKTPKIIVAKTPRK